jgi:hypothetical protein
MFRKRILEVALTTAVALAALPPGRAADLAAAPDRWHPHHRLVWGPHLYNGLPVSFGYGLCYQHRLLLTPWGLRERLVNQCW